LSTHNDVHFLVTPLLRQRINATLITPTARVTFFLRQFGTFGGERKPLPTVTRLTTMMN